MSASYRCEGLSLVADSTGGAADSEAVAMFFDRARLLDAQFDADPEVVAELCAELDGMPLAIELATARSAALGVSGLRAGLSDRLRLLSGGHGGDRRHRSLRAMLDWSHELLDDEERTALRRLGRFAGDFDIAAAAAVIDMPAATVADLFGRLADKSFLVHRQTRQRWSLLETVRAYALDKLTEAGELDAVTERYVAWAVDVATGIEDRLENDESYRAELDAVVDNLRAALGLADGHLAARLARTLGHLTFARRFLAEARGHYLRAADLEPDGTQAARDLWSAARVAQVENIGQLRYEYGVAAADRAAAAGDPATQSAVLAEAVSLATRFPALFEHDVELAELQEALRLAHEVAPPDDVSARAQLVAADAWTNTRVVEVPDVTMFEAALEAAERADDPILVSAALDALGSAQMMNGQLARTHEFGARRLSLLARLPSASASSRHRDPRHPPHDGGERDQRGCGRVRPRDCTAIRRRGAGRGCSTDGPQQADRAARAARPFRRGDRSRRTSPRNMGGLRSARRALAGAEPLLARAAALAPW